ncbi:hypothetical protein HELRODRAFT_75273 [Helobdella robusta]|uniref:adenylate cyclase n=1 Tax=Helobdella robusta TaxID=6412 RepID=T1G232_HELRO|nr:hypothetical protein HELRODRAFT_75273 [Helobdella robusta]ESO07955.1 hypothetical protein HELRODRAFT_75273 [Helobdella robusta]
MASKNAEKIEVGTIEVKVIPSNGAPEKATLLTVQPQKSILPVMFERSAKSFWNPRFDSDVLEKYHKEISLQQTLRIFRYALLYVALSCAAWALFVGFHPLFVHNHRCFLIGLLALFVSVVVIFIISFTKYYGKTQTGLSVVLAFVLSLFSLIFYYRASEGDMSFVAIFIGCVEIILLIYTFIPMPMFFCLAIGVVYSIIFEVLSAILTPINNVYYIIGRILLHIAIHSLGVHLFVISQVRQRSTFLKVGQSIKSRRDVQTEKQFKQDMIHSLMPPKVAQEVMSSRDPKGGSTGDGNEKTPQVQMGLGGGPMTFRSFHMSKMENVSILFADIVGFTKMSSNKSAEHLVSLLSDLFGRFDDICYKCGCEKISTLGDCYYCVSGCPEPRPDHARCCVEMGLSMCIAIKQFDEDHKEEVNMRVGVHTGTVLCGLVGTRRFKFDVWSHDVTIANSMESEGRPGCVHISDYTYKFVKDDYVVEKGESVPGSLVGWSICWLVSWSIG